MTRFILLLLLLITVTAQAQTYYVQPAFFAADNGDSKLLRDASGILMRVSADCEIPDYTPARFDTITQTLVYNSEIATAQDSEVFYIEAEFACNVLDYMGAYKSNVISITTSATYDVTHGYLDVRNILLTNGFEPTGEIFEKGTLLYDPASNCFNIEELEP